MGKLIKKYAFPVAALLVIAWGCLHYFSFMSKMLNPPTVDVILENFSEQDAIEFCTSPDVLEVLKVSPEKCLEHMNRLREEYRQ